MSILEAFIHAPLARTLGWSLVHFLWEGTLIALLLAVLLFLCGPGPARLRYGLCCLALLAMPAMFGLTVALTLPASQATPAQTPLLRPAIPGGASPVPAPTPRPLSERMRAALPWVVPFWMAGVLLCYLRSLASWMAAQRLRRTGVCAAPREWQERLCGLGARIRISQPVILLESCLVDVPVVIGFVRPAILVPVGLLMGLSTEQVESILLHELAHIRRRDYLVNVLQNFVEGLLFYHPAVWWVSGRVRAERENCCDDVVVKLNGDARGYAAALAMLENSRWPAREPALAANGGSLMLRIQRLIQKPEQRRTSAPVFAAGLLVVSLGVAVGGWQTKPAAVSPKGAIENPAEAAALPASPQPLKLPVPLLAQVAPTKKQGPPARPLTERQVDESPYRKWLNEDVAYIITDAERAAYKLLQTGEEHERFIEQFWLRRDPTPGTVENEFKEEHYRRIAYTNERFAANIPGWKTDRGRIYITYGPADEIESHPSGGKYERPAEQGGGATSTFPFEQWLYRHIEGVGNNVVIEFVDPSMSGEYRMTMDPSEKDALRFILPREPQLLAGTSKAGATVQSMGAAAALVSVPLNAYGNHAVNVLVRVVTATRRPVTSFQDTIQGPAPLYTKFIAIPAGVYRLVVVVKDVTTGAIAGDDISFEVK